jgi:hypothetical protein
MVSVPGIGPVIATELLITTNEMQTIMTLKNWLAMRVLPPLSTDRAVAFVKPE